MNSNNPIRNYKLAISGKFKDIPTEVASMDESTFNDPENNKIFHAVHEVILKMVKTSRNTILENLKQDIVLVVSDEEPGLEMPKLQIEGVTVRYEFNSADVKYFLFFLENEVNPVFLKGKVYSVLPVEGIKSEIREVSLCKTIKALNASVGY